MTRVSVESVSFAYPGGDGNVLSDLSLEIEDGAAHAILGASGAGKTTLLNILSGLLVPDSGMIRFGDRDVTAVLPRDRNIAQVFQFPVLYDALDVKANLAFPLRNRGYEAAAERVTYIAEELELTAVLDAKPRQLSLFEKQLVSVGKALVRPDIGVVLLDEPLTAVEPRRKWQLRQSLKRVQADLGVTMVYVTHDQTEALTFANHVSVLSVDGILQTGTPEEIYDSPSHEFVGSFVGSPGMDFLRGLALAGVAPAQSLGCRPEWARLCDPADAHVTGTSGAHAVSGTEADEPVGDVAVVTEFGPLNVRHRGSIEPDQTVGVRFLKGALFEGGELVNTIEF